MTYEDELIISCFKRNFEKYADKKIVLYGTGLKTKLILENIPEFNVIGLMDREKTDGELYGKKILSLTEVQQQKADVIIIVSLITSVKEIYERISPLCQANRIGLYYMSGDKPQDVFGTIHKIPNPDQSVEISEAYVKQQIEKNDIICFDIFDTLLMCKTLFMQDVFKIVESRAMQNGVQVPRFAEARLSAEKRCEKNNPNLYDIYSDLQSNETISRWESEQLLALELETYQRIFIKRDKVFSLFEYAIDKGKKVALIADTCLPKEILSKILSSFGINGYTDLFLSCEQKKSIAHGLFESIQEENGKAKYLYIGSHAAGKVETLYRQNVSLCLMKTGMELFESSRYSEIMSIVKTVNERSLIGLFLSRVFNDPFRYPDHNGVVTIVDIEEIGYLFVGPLVIDYIIWLIQKVNTCDYDKLLFAARDGYLLQQIFDFTVNEMKLEGIPDHAYFLTSRKVCLAAGIERDDDIIKNASLPYDRTFEEMLVTKFNLKPEEISPYDEGEYEDGIDYILAHKEKIYEHSAESRSNYLNYLGNLGVSREKKYAFIDLVSSGTCLASLRRIISDNVDGLYAGRILVDVEEKKRLPIEARFIDGAPHYNLIRNSYYIENYWFLELVITALSTTLIDFGSDGTPIFGEEKRTAEELKFVAEMQIGITKYAQEYIHSVYIRNQRINKWVISKLFSFKDEKFTYKQDRIFESLILHEDLGLGVLTVPK